MVLNSCIRGLMCVGALTFGAGQIAQAQAPQGSPGQQPSAQSQQSSQQDSAAAGASRETVTSADVTDQEVEQFARIYQDVTQIQKESAKQLDGTQDGAATARLKQEANQKMAEAVQSHGMTVERFNAIGRSLNQDPTLKQRIQQKIQELRQPA